MEFRHSCFYHLRRVISHSGTLAACLLNSTRRTFRSQAPASTKRAHKASLSTNERASIRIMDASVSLVQRMPYTTAFPKALGTGLLVSTARPVSTDLRAKMERLIDGYEHVLSRFRADSLVTRIGNAEHGGHFDFPNWAGPLFDLYDALHDVTELHRRNRRRRALGRFARTPCMGARRSTFR